jgi:hypothetical protein
MFVILIECSDSVVPQVFGSFNAYALAEKYLKNRGWSCHKAGRFSFWTTSNVFGRAYIEELKPLPV